LVTCLRWNNCRTLCRSWVYVSWQSYCIRSTHLTDHLFGLWLQLGEEGKQHLIAIFSVTFLSKFRNSQLEVRKKRKKRRVETVCNGSQYSRRSQVVKFVPIPRDLLPIPYHIPSAIAPIPYPKPATLCPYPYPKPATVTTQSHEYHLHKFCITENYHTPRPHLLYFISDVRTYSHVK